MEDNNIVVFEDGEITVKVTLEHETVWLSME